MFSIIHERTGMRCWEAQKEAAIIHSCCGIVFQAYVRQKRDRREKDLPGKRVKACNKRKRRIEK